MSSVTELGRMACPSVSATEAARECGYRCAIHSAYFVMRTSDILMAWTWLDTPGSDECTGRGPDYV